MLSQDRLELVKTVVDDGLFFRKIGTIWKGRMSFACNEDDVNYGMGERVLQASKYRITCERDVNVKEFRVAKSISKSFNSFCKDHVYRTRYGLFVHSSNMDKFFEAFKETRRKVDELRDRLITDRDRIIEDMKEQYAPVVIDIWRRRYGDEGDPPHNYMDMMLERYVSRFPDDNLLQSRMRIEMIQVTPVIDGNMRISECVDPEDHNMKVYRAVYDAMTRKREILYYTSEGLAKFLGEKEDSGRKIAGAYKRIFLKMRGYITLMHYDLELSEMLNALCDTLSVCDDRRDKDVILGMLKGISEKVKTDKMLVIHV